jgi:hypothetical protein
MKILYRGYLYEAVENLAAFQNSLRVKYGIDLDLLADNKGGIVISKIVVPKESRGSGVGSNVMHEIVQHADTLGVPLYLSPADKKDGWGTTSKDRLIQFYKQFGFVENKGRNRDFRFSYSMYRLPKKSTLMEMPNRINSLEDDDDYRLKEIEKMADATEEVDSQYYQGTDWSIREYKSEPTRGMLYITDKDQPVGYVKFNKFHSIPNAIWIQFTYLIENSRGEGLMSKGYEYLLNYFGALVSDTDITDDSANLYYKLSQKYKSGIFNNRTKEFKEMKFDSPEYLQIEKEAHIAGTSKDILWVIIKNP